MSGFAPLERIPGKGRSALTRIQVYGRMIKFSHTVFALPFALAAVILAQRQHPVTARSIFWILIAMVGARSAAMGFNRITDARFDARNPRTAGREIPSGRLSTAATAVFVVLSSIIFIQASAMLGDLCFYLSFPVLGVLLLYSYTKRFTWMAHLYLGFAISLAPLGAWIAVTGRFSWQILPLSLALMTYIAGFDILYACQDIDFDRSEGLFSIPVRFGVDGALWISRLIHGLSFGLFLALFFIFDMRGPYLMCVGAIGFLLLLEHWLVRPDDLSRIHIAFFHVNSIISVSLLTGVAGDELIRRLF
ncbi:MAG: UbiA-like polyprenyltransferase [Desulfococcaceae bacterium]